MNIKQFIKDKQTGASGSHKTVKIRIVILLLILAAAAWYFAGRNDDEIVLAGEVQTTVYSHISEVSGKITEASAEPGQIVNKGDVLMVIDSSDQEYALEQLKLTLVQKQSALESLLKGSDIELIKQAESSVAVAQASYEKANKDYLSTLSLFEEGATSQNSLNNAEYLMEVSKAQLDTANQQLYALLSGADDEAIKSAEAGVKQIESQIEQMEEKLDKFIIKAEVDGTVISKNYTLGDMVSHGFDLIDLASLDENFILAYLPAESVHLADYGQKIAIIADGREYSGELFYIDVKSQYTPKDMQTSDNKNKDSVKIKVKINRDIPLKPGQKVKLIIEKSN